MCDRSADGGHCCLSGMQSPDAPSLTALDNEEEAWTISRCELLITRLLDGGETLTAHDDTEQDTNHEVPYGHANHNGSNGDIFQTER